MIIFVSSGKKHLSLLYFRLKITFYNAFLACTGEKRHFCAKCYIVLAFQLFADILYSLSYSNIPPLDLLSHMFASVFFLALNSEHTKWFRHFGVCETKCIYSNATQSFVELHFVYRVAGTFTTFHTVTIRQISTTFGNTIVVLLTFGR